MQLGMVGLGRMGANMTERLRAAGHDVKTFDPNVDSRTAGSLEELVQQLDAPRSVWLMVPAGIVDSIVGELAPHLTEGDTIIDGGNSYYVDDLRRSGELSGKGIHYMDVGVSGGVWGRERGYCLMVGGDDEAVGRLTPVLEALAPGVDAAVRTPGRKGDPSPEEQGWLHCGPSGAGHFVKMVHNGIEYGLMQAYAEGLNVLEHADVGQARAGDGRRDDAAARPRPLQVRPRHRGRHRALAARLGDLLVAARPDRGGVARDATSSTSTRATSATPARDAGRCRPRSRKAYPRRCSPPRCSTGSPPAARPTSATASSPRCARASAATSRRAQNRVRSSDRDRRAARPAGGEPARRGPRPPQDARSLRARHLRRLRRPDAQEDHAGAVRARRPPPAAAALRDRRRRAHRRRRRLLPAGHGDGGEAARARPVPAGDLGRARAEAPLRRDRLRGLGRRGQGARPARQARRGRAARRQPPLLPRGASAGLPHHRRGPRQAARSARLDAARRREAVRPRPRVGEAADRDALRVLQRGRDLPDRPLPGQGDGPEHARAPLRERDLRADLEPPVRRPRPDHRGRVDRDRGASRLLRARGRDPGHLPEPPAATARDHGDGAADRLHLRLGAQREGQGAARPPHARTEIGRARAVRARLQSRARRSWRTARRRAWRPTR